MTVNNEANNGGPKKSRVNEVVSQVRQSVCCANVLSQNTCTRYLSSLTIVSHGVYRSGWHGPVNRGPRHLEKVAPKYAEPSQTGVPRLSRAYSTSSWPVPGGDHMSTANQDADEWFFVSRDGPVSLVLPRFRPKLAATCFSEICRFCVARMTCQVAYKERSQQLGSRF